MAYWNKTAQTASSAFTRIGHPGTFYNVLEVKGTSQVDFTGSNYGYGAIMVSGTLGPASRIELSGGGEITSSVLSGLGIVDISPKKIYGGVAGSAVIYVFKKQLI